MGYNRKVLLKKLPKELRKKVIKNMKRNYSPHVIHNFLKGKSSCLHHFINDALTWDDTLEGAHYWSTVFYRLSNIWWKNKENGNIQ